MTADLSPLRLLLVTLAGLGKPPPIAGRRVPGGGEPGAQGAVEGAACRV